MKLEWEGREEGDENWDWRGPGWRGPGVEN